MDDVYVVEIAVTGPKGAPKDRVAEGAVGRGRSDGSDFETVYNDSVALDPLDLGKEPLDYMEANYGITPEDLYAGQLHLPHDEFSFSRDVLADTYTYPCAFSTFNNGFNFRDSTGCTVYDNTASRTLHGPDPERVRKGKAILQALYKDLSER